MARRRRRSSKGSVRCSAPPSATENPLYPHSRRFACAVPSPASHSRSPPHRPARPWPTTRRSTIHDPYVRLAPPNAPATGAFMVIRNGGGSDRQLVKAESSVAKIVQLHNHIDENGVMKMREVPGIDIKANGQAELKPGSYHVMLIDLTTQLKEGDSVPLTLRFDDGSSLQVSAPVRKLQMTMPTGKEMGGMKHQTQ
ncbi:MAG: copper chaperone PCu(A)C [Propionivibrio sp.]